MRFDLKYQLYCSIFRVLVAVEAVIVESWDLVVSVWLSTKKLAVDLKSVGLGPISKVYWAGVAYSLYLIQFTLVISVIFLLTFGPDGANQIQVPSASFAIFVGMTVLLSWLFAFTLLCILRSIIGIRSVFRRIWSKYTVVDTPVYSESAKHNQQPGEYQRALTFLSSTFAYIYYFGILWAEQSLDIQVNQVIQDAGITEALRIVAIVFGTIELRVFSILGLDEGTLSFLVIMLLPSVFQLIPARNMTHSREESLRDRYSNFESRSSKVSYLVVSAGMLLATGLFYFSLLAEL